MHDGCSKMVETSAVQIRLATPDDLTSLACLLHDSFVEYRSLYTQEGFAATTPSNDQLLQRMNEGPVWIANKPTSRSAQCQQSRAEMICTFVVWQ